MKIGNTRKRGKKGVDCLARFKGIDPVSAIWDQRILGYAGSGPSWYGSFERMLEEKH